jgi:hypothetical protein
MTTTLTTATLGRYAGNMGRFHAIAEASFTRPDNTTHYASGDGITNSTSAPSAIVFEDCTRWFGTSAVLTGAFIIKSTTTTSNANFTLHLWNDVPPQIPNDNAAYSPTARANFSNYVGAMTVDKTSAAFTYGDGIGKQFLLPIGSFPFTISATSRRLYGVLQANSNYAPGALEQFRFKLYIEQN